MLSPRPRTVSSPSLRRALALAAAASAVGASAARAQGGAPVAARHVDARHVDARHVDARMDADSLAPRRSVGALALGGAVGAAAGIGAGLVVGLAAANSCGGEDCGWPAAVVSVALGEALGLAAGVHAAVGSRGSLAPAALASVGLTALAAGGIALAGEHSTPAAVMFLSLPVAQLAATIALERRRR
jgi:hypothetical protein